MNFQAACRYVRKNPSKVMTSDRFTIEFDLKVECFDKRYLRCLSPAQLPDAMSYDYEVQE